MIHLKLLDKCNAYRMGDMHIQHEDRYWIISRSFGKGVELIESLSNQQRRSQPVKYKNILELLNAMCKCNNKDLEAFDLRDKQHMKVRLV